MVEVICDTSFLIHLSTNKIKNLSNIETEIGPISFVVPKIVVKELEHLLEDSDKKIIAEKIHDDALLNLEGMDSKMLSLLAQNNIITLDDFADLATFELIDKEVGIFKDLELDQRVVDGMIMKAREKWFAEEK